eukprot:Selendium_serpulae@DN5239_c0_g1_i3.p2
MPRSAVKTRNQDTFEGFDDELSSLLESLSHRRKEVDESIHKGHEDKRKLEEDILSKQKKLESLVESISKQEKEREDIDRTTTEAKGTYGKLLESSHDLIGSVKREADCNTFRRTPFELDRLASRVFDP